jgi:hypothetical protein
MLVYASNFYFSAENGRHKLIECIARWAGNRANRSSVDPKILAHGIRELRLRDNSILSAKSTLIENEALLYPYLFCAQLSHADSDIPGRRWVTEIGIRQDTASSSFHCSVLLKTDEISTRVNASIQVTRPKVVQLLCDQCAIGGFTPGASVKRLEEKSDASAFLQLVERDDRSWPIVIISSNRDGSYPVEPERMRSLLIGIADVVQVSKTANTFEIEEVLGRRYAAWGGAINILFRPRKSDRGSYCQTVLLLPSTIAEMIDGGRSVESEVLASVTHRTNLPNSWRHTSLEMVGQAILRAQLSRSISNAKLGEDSSEYIQLLEAADNEIRTLEKDISNLRIEIEDRDGQLDKYKAKIDGLQHALSGQQSAGSNSESDSSVLHPFRDIAHSIIAKDPKLEQALQLICILFPDRVTVLDSAFESAQESDKDGFKHKAKALDLLWKFANGYWEVLADGRGDQQAKSTFGHDAYAQNEGQALTTEGRRRRTFFYHNQEILMDKHLKIGVKDSAAETLRVHFEWYANEKRLVIGHCGKHLDF